MVSIRYFNETSHQLERFAAEHCQARRARRNATLLRSERTLRALGPFGLMEGGGGWGCACRCWTASASLRRCYKFRPDTTTKLPPLPGSTIDWAHEGAMVQINHLLSATGDARNATLAEMSARKLSPPIYEAAVEFLLACETE